MYYLFLYHYKNACMNAPQYYFTRTVHALLTLGFYLKKIFFPRKMIKYERMSPTSNRRLPTNIYFERILSVVE